MSFAVEWTRRSRKELSNLDPQVARTLVHFMAERVHGCDDPRSLGKTLRESDLWRYRVGDYRILCLIEDDRLLVLVVELGHRRQVYRR
ncbi:MAG: type II toxin-antitoxin system RelE/ParE family toxin [Nocardioides sp.]